MCIMPPMCTVHNTAYQRLHIKTWADNSFFPKLDFICVIDRYEHPT